MDMPDGGVRVLNDGYVALVDSMGDDLRVVNAAYASFSKRATAFTDKHKRLIDYLVTHGHTSPFRHCIMTFEVYAPLMVARQWWKYIIGSAHGEPMEIAFQGWNEASRRYVTLPPEFYTPAEWRAAPENKKQGSGGALPDTSARGLTDSLKKYVAAGEALYAEALKNGVAPEQARLFLPMYGLYTSWYWTVSLQGVAHFLRERLDDRAQFEIREYAKAIQHFTRRLFPYSLTAFLQKGA